MYAKKSDIEKRIGADVLVMLADDNSDGVADDAVINAVLDQASARIDAALGARYNVPVSPAPSVLSSVCVSLAVPVLFARRREELPPEHEKLRNAALDLLSSILSGEISLPGIASQSLPESTTREKGKHFSQERLLEF